MKRYTLRALVRTPHGLISFPFANQINDMLLLGNAKAQYMVHMDQLDVDNLNPKLVNDIKDKNVILQKIPSELEDPNGVILQMGDEAINVNPSLLLGSALQLNKSTFDKNDPGLIGTVTVDDPFMIKNNAIDISNSREYAEVFELSNKLNVNDSNKYKLFHAKNERTIKLAEIARDLDAVKEHGISVGEEVDFGFVMYRGKPESIETKKLYHGLRVLAAIHKRGVIMGHTELYTGKIDMLTASYYAGVDKIDKLHFLVGSKTLIDKYKDDTLRLFKLATVYDVAIICNKINKEWNINEYISEYMKSNIKEWFAEIIIDKFINKYKNK
jgi:hypothetical protein